MPRHPASLTLAIIAGIAVAAVTSAQAAAPASLPSFETLDTNNDGKISLNEASANDDLFVSFKKLDVNRDGELTKAEFAAYSPGR